MSSPLDLTVLEGAGGSRATFVLAHGAGAGRQHPWMVRWAAGLASRGLRVVTFDFPYMQAGRRAPDRPAILEAHYRAVVTETARRFPREPLVIGGKSMGGRIASQIAAGTLPVRALVFFGYPLHPPSQPDKRRDAHLPSIELPMLFVSGTRDGFASPAEMRALVRKLGTRATLMLVEGGDHSLAVPKRGTNETQAEVDARVWDAASAFILPDRSRSPRPPRRRPRARRRRRAARRAAP